MIRRYILFKGIMSWVIVFLAAVGFIDILLKTQSFATGTSGVVHAEPMLSEQLRLFMTPGSDRKLSRQMEFADRWLTDARVVIDHGKTSQARQPLRHYQTWVANLIKILDARAHRGYGRGEVALDTVNLESFQKDAAKNLVNLLLLTPRVTGKTGEELFQAAHDTERLIAAVCDARACDPNPRLATYAKLYLIGLLSRADLTDLLSAKTRGETFERIDHLITAGTLTQADEYALAIKPELKILASQTFLDAKKISAYYLYNQLKSSVAVVLYASGQPKLQEKIGDFLVDFQPDGKTMIPEEIRPYLVAHLLTMDSAFQLASELAYIKPDELSQFDQDKKLYQAIFMALRSVFGVHLPNRQGDSFTPLPTDQIVDLYRGLFKALMENGSFGVNQLVTAPPGWTPSQWQSQVELISKYLMNRSNQSSPPTVPSWIQTPIFDRMNNQEYQALLGRLQVEYLDYQAPLIAWRVESFARYELGGQLKKYLGLTPSSINQSSPEVISGGKPTPPPTTNEVIQELLNHEQSKLRYQLEVTQPLQPTSPNGQLDRLPSIEGQPGEHEPAPAILPNFQADQSSGQPPGEKENVPPASADDSSPKEWQYDQGQYEHHQTDLGDRPPEAQDSQPADDVFTPKDSSPEAVSPEQPTESPAPVPQ